MKLSFDLEGTRPFLSRAKLEKRLFLPRKKKGGGITEMLGYTARPQQRGNPAERLLILPHVGLGLNLRLVVL